jgi:tetratricopeptide (TPR) repeat protein
LKVAGGTVQRSVFIGAFEEVVRTYRLGLSLPALNRALAERTEAIRLTPKNGRAYAERADLLYDKGDFERAITDYGDAIRLGLREADVFRGRGMAHASRGEYAEAIADYDAALRIEPNHAETLHNRALAHGKQGDTKRALADLNEVLRAEPENAVALSDRGFLHTEAGELDKALADYQAAVELSPRSASAHQRLAWLLATSTKDRLRDGKKALEHAERACALTNRKDAVCLQTLAAAQAECGRFDEAVTVLKTALQLATEKQKAEWRPRLERYEGKKAYRE